MSYIKAIGIMERGGYSQQGYSPRRALVAEAPSGGMFFGQRILVSGGGGIVGSALIARILREGGAVIAVRLWSVRCSLHAQPSRITRGSWALTHFPPAAGTHAALG